LRKERVKTVRARFAIIDAQVLTSPLKIGPAFRAQLMVIVTDSVAFLTLHGGTSGKESRVQNIIT
jgi:hypothetical protein